MTKISLLLGALLLGSASLYGCGSDTNGSRRLAGKFIRSGAAITFLPAFDQQLTHFTIRPATSMTPVLRNLVGVWNATEVDASAGNPHSWQFLFFHEYPVHGGTGTVAAPNPFFLQALGPPSPLTTAPKTLPP